MIEEREGVIALKDWKYQDIQMGRSRLKHHACKARDYSDRLSSLQVLSDLTWSRETRGASRNQVKTTSFSAHWLTLKGLTTEK